MSALMQGQWEACGNLVRTARTAEDAAGWLVAEVPVTLPGSLDVARLIAAAPKLLDVAQMVLDTAYDSYPAQLIVAASEAIEEAKGAQS